MARRKRTPQAPFPGILNLLKGHFLAGLLVLVPFAVIGWILAAAVAEIWQLHALLPQDWLPTHLVEDQALFMLVNIAFTFGALIVLAVLVSSLGWISKNYVGRKTLLFFGDLIARIPIIRTVYSALDQLLKALTVGGGKQFSRVVYVEYPRKGIWTLAFVTGPANAAGFSGAHLNIYVPTTPNPTSGFFLIVPEADVRESHLKVEDAFKSIISLGIAQS
jgi:uncharacterized membrane protein